MTDRIDWRRVEEKTFNDLAEALLVREYTGDGLVAMAIDGRGGDGGIDIDVTVERTGQITNIFQVKYFPEGFSGGHIKRRSQIKSSLDMAMNEHHPPVWTLVTPRKVSVQERKAVLDMRHGRVVRIRFVGPVELDLLLAKYPEIQAHFLEDYAVKLLSSINRPEAVLAQPRDLESESRRMQRQLDGRSQYWGVAFGVGPDGTYTETIYSKRSDAMTREPLKVSFSASFSPDHEDLRLQFQAGMDYGITRPLVLPADVVTSFKKSGASWFAEESDGGEIHLIPLQQEQAQSVRVVAYDSGGLRLAAISGISKNIVSGAKGVSVDVDFGGGLKQLWRFPHDLTTSGEVKFEYGPTGYRARDVRSALRFINQLPQTDRLTVAIGESDPIPLVVSGGTSLAIPASFSDLVEDLSFIENELEVSLVLPEDGVSNDDRLWVRIVVKMLKGEAVPYPGINGFNFELTGDVAPGIEGFLANGGAIAVSTPTWAVNLLGTELYLGDVINYHPRVSAVDGAAHSAALREGKGAGRHVQARGAGGLPFTIYSPSRLPVGKAVITSGWGIIDAPEAPNLAELQALQVEHKGALPIDPPSLHLN